MTDRVDREMTISRNEFFRLLPIALTEYDYQVSGNRISFSYKEGQIDIMIKKETNRKIASLQLPVMHIEFQFQSVDETGRSDVLRHFFKVYQRGGG